MVEGNKNEVGSHSVGPCVVVRPCMGPYYVGPYVGDPYVMAGDVSGDNDDDCQVSYMSDEKEDENEKE